MKRPKQAPARTAYSILRNFGNDNLLLYIRKKMPVEFDSHYFIKDFLDNHKELYEDMLDTHAAEGDCKHRKQRISILMGLYLWNNFRSLGITPKQKVSSSGLTDKDGKCQKWSNPNSEVI